MIHLHTHSNFSVGDALPSPEDYAKQIGEGGVLALTDHDTLAGMIYHDKACKKHGVKPIQGAEVKTEHGNLTLLCKDYSGLQNLFKILSSGKAVSNDLLNEFSGGLLALSGDTSSYVSRSILGQDKKEIVKSVKTLKEIYGDSFYLEQIDWNLEECRIINKNIDYISRKTGIKKVKTNDVHYLTKEDAQAQMVLMLDRFNKKRDLNTLMWHIHSEAWLKPMPECAVAKEIAERCNVSIKFVPPKLPDFPIPKGFKSTEDYLIHVSKKGLEKRGMQKHIKRLMYEIKVICNMGFAGYFLITWDFVNWAIKQGIPVGPGRGSGAGSLVAYCLNITNVDPIKYDLMFERFMNPERVSMPDFDIDFGQYKREEVMRYVVRKYGEDDVCQIQTFGALKPRSAWKAAASALRVNAQDSDAFSKLLPGQDNSLEKTTLADIFDEDGLVKDDAPIEYQKISKYLTKKRSAVISIARKMEGAYKSIGKHAAGLIITRGKVIDNIPASREPDDSITKYSSQLDKYVVEDMGAIKFDFLGLSELDVIAYTVKSIRKSEPDFDINNIPMDDENVFKMISEGRTNGVFQLSGDGIAAFCCFLKPECFMDIVAISALYRPGTKDMEMDIEYAKRKNGLKPVEYLHPDLEEALSDTYGIIVYQEQVIAIPQIIAGYTLAEADLLRRAVGKKDLAKMKKHEHKLIQGGIKNGYSEELMVQLWEMINAFARYGFNKSHAVAYSVISYQGAWLKYHYPAKFLAAQIQVRDFDQMISFVREAREDFNLKVNEPEVGKSRIKTREQNNEIWLGFQTIKSLGEAVCRKIQGKFFKDIFDFCANIEPNKRDFEALVYSGSLDCFFKGGDPQNFRAQLIDSWEVLKSIKETNQLSLFGNTEIFALSQDYHPFEWQFMLAKEYQYLGRYRTGHPCDEFEEHAKFIGVNKIKNIVGHNHFYTLCCVIVDFKEIKTKNGDLMCFIKVQDDTGEFDITVFPDQYSDKEKFCYEDEPSKVKYITIKSNYRNERIEGIYHEMADA